MDSFLQIFKENKYPKLYQVLGISQNASQQSIKNAYKKLSLEKHPDRGGTSEEMALINSAYEILSDRNKKEIYDLFGSTYNIDELSHFYKGFLVISKYFPILLQTYIEYKLNLKDLLMHFATGSKKLNDNKLGFYHVAGFKIVHYIVENEISSQLSPSNERSKYWLSEIIATLVAAPFEIAAYKAFKVENGFTIKNLSNYFVFNKSTGKLGIFKLLASSVAEYGNIYKTSWKQILAMICFRLCYTAIEYHLSAISDFAEHKYLMSVRESELNGVLFSDIPQQNEEEGDVVVIEDENQNQDDQEYDDIDDDDDDEFIKVNLVERFKNVNNANHLNNNNTTNNGNAGSGDIKWLLLHKLTYGAKYIVPSLCFSLYRLWNVVDPQTTSKKYSYFEAVPLIKSAIFESIFMTYGSEKLLLLAHYSLSILKQKTKDLIFFINQQ